MKQEAHLLYREQLAWAGGFFSGEGYTGLTRYRKTERAHYKKYPVMTIAQTGNGEELNRFNNAIENIGKVRGPYGPYAKNKKAYFQFEISGFERVQAVFAMLYTFLSTAKQEQAIKVLDAYLAQPHRIHNKLKTHCSSGHKYTENTTYVVPKTGWRQCKICRNIRNRRLLSVSYC